MSEVDRAEADRAEEKRQLVPYRRFVRVVFFILLTILCAFVLRGIIRSLDRMPSATRSSVTVDVRALRACAEDLASLERRLRLSAAELMGRPGTEPAETWQTFAGKLELERLAIVTRCNLDDPSPDPAVNDLRTAASEIEAMASSYGLLYDRLKADGREHSREATEAIRRAATALETR